MPGAADRFDFTTPPAEYPDAETMLFDRIPVSQLTPEQTIAALLTAGRVVKRSQTMEEFLEELKRRQDRFNTIWTVAISTAALLLGLYLGGRYL